MTCARAVWAEPPICTGNWNVWQYCVRDTPIVVRPVWLTSAPVRLLPIRLTTVAVDSVVVAVVPATPRMTVIVERRRRVAVDLDTLGRPVGVDQLEDVVIHQERRVAEHQTGRRATPRSPWRAWSTDCGTGGSTSGSRRARPGRTAAGSRAGFGWRTSCARRR